MKKVAGAESNPAVKSDDGVRDVEAYLASVSEPSRTTLETIRAVIRAVVPEETTEALSYGMPAFRYKRRAGGLRGVQKPLQLLSHERVPDRYA
jgi:hypothetical protein